MSSVSPIALLGPQRFHPVVAETLVELGVADGPVALITAGWQEREAEDVELAEHLGGETVNLRLYERTEAVFERDDELHQALRRRQDRLRELQELYRERLHHALAAAKEMMERQGSPDLVAAARRSAINAVRTLDRAHLRAASDLLDGFDAHWRPERRPVLREAIDELEGQVERCAAIAIAGGHVATLYNRLRLFGVDRWLARYPVVAWSAGAMALAPRIVLFHDHPPQGAGDAEVLGPGFGTYGGLLPLPDASRRLNLGDPLRVALFARRFAPLRCVALDAERGVTLDGDGRHARSGTVCLGRAGHVRPLGRSG